MGQGGTSCVSEDARDGRVTVRVPILFQICLVSLFFGVLSTGCGKKAPPISYDVTVPSPILDLESRVREGRLLLRWSMPEAPDGSKMPAVREFNVLREETSLEKAWCEECPERLETLDVLAMETKDKFSLIDDRVVYEDKRVSYGHRYVYRVISVSRRGYKSERSNRVVVAWDAPPPAPEDVEGSGDDRAAVIRWSPVDGAEGYRIYRRQGERPWGEAVGEVGPDESSYRDAGLANRVVYRYAVRSLRRLGPTVIEGAGSAEIVVKPEDRRAPAAPVGLMAIPLAAGVELSWQRSTEPDVLGYFVYRRVQGGDDYGRLNDEPVRDALYMDRTVVLGESYEYVVTVVDNSPQRNESGFSESVSVTYLVVTEKWPWSEHSEVSGPNRTARSNCSIALLVQSASPCEVWLNR